MNLKNKYQYGCIPINIETKTSDWDKFYSGYFKILFLIKGSKVNIDFEEYVCDKDTFFFFNEEHSFEVLYHPNGQMIFFHPDFYCVEIHDQELACDGILYSNVLTTPYIYLDDYQSKKLCKIIKEIDDEQICRDNWSEEKIRILIKYLIIESTRIWVKQWDQDSIELSEQQEFTRKFSQLVDRNFTTKHKVVDYAEMLNVTTKTLNKRIKDDCGISPSCVIVNRIMLQAKRLLAYTDLSVKEIAYSLGYEDISYFNRYFKIQANITPLEFRKNNIAVRKTL